MRFEISKAMGNVRNIVEDLYILSGATLEYFGLPWGGVAPILVLW
jgi:hypothetical protein